MIYAKPKALDWLNAKKLERRKQVCLRLSSFLDNPLESGKINSIFSSLEQLQLMNLLVLLHL